MENFKANSAVKRERLASIENEIDVHDEKISKINGKIDKISSELKENHQLLEKRKTLLNHDKCPLCNHDLNAKK